MIHKHWFAVLTLGMLVVTTGCHRGAKDSQSSGKKLPAGSSVWVAFYNVENLFDTDDDPGKDDSEFLPGSELDWTPEKYLEKLDNLTLAITAMNNGKGPDILGLAEVENAQTLSDWTKMTSLKSRNYEYVLEEGPDPRGIDVALMYDPALFAYQGHEVFAVDFPGEPDYITRPILRVDGTISGEEVSVVVVHWPSRRDGEKESEPRRIAAARAVNVAIKDRLADHPDSDIMIMGDFNDDPSDRSLQEILGATTSEGNMANGKFYNPVGRLHDPESRGTLTYQGKWNLFDQILLSANLLDEEGSLEYIEESAGIHDPEFMQVGGDSRAKDAPRRAIYRGQFQDRGFSDHFPVYLRLRVR